MHFFAGVLLKCPLLDASFPNTGVYLLTMHPHAARCCLLGAAVGDAIGLPAEGLSPRRAARLFSDPNRHNLLFGRGMLSDDTEHACMAAQALLASNCDPDRFEESLAAHLHQWTLALPAATGLATLRAGVKLCIGFGPNRSGVFSAGNGPMMRAPIIGAATPDLARIAPLIRASTRLTHTDPRAEDAALIIALTAHLRVLGQPISVAAIRAMAIDTAQRPLHDDVLRSLDQTERATHADWSAPKFATHLGLQRGVTGYALHTLPISLLAVCRAGDGLRAGVLDVIACGGDTDSTAAIVGGIIGAGGIEPPDDWLNGIIDWPRTTNWIADLGNRIDNPTAHASRPPPAVFYPAALARNAVFAGVVLTHGVRRLLPPY